MENVLKKTQLTWMNQGKEGVQTEGKGGKRHSHTTDKEREKKRVKICFTFTLNPNSAAQYTTFITSFRALSCTFIWVQNFFRNLNSAPDTISLDILSENW